MNNYLKKLKNSEYNNKIKLIAYIFFILIIIFIFRFSNNQSTSADKDKPKDIVDETLSLLLPLKSNNYDVNIDIIIDNDLINIKRTMQNENEEIFSITYRGEEKLYLRDNSNYYIVSDNSVVKLNTYEKPTDYDDTFLLASNIIKLLENKNIASTTLSEEKYYIKRYKTSLENILSIYNEIKNTNLFTSLSKEIIVDIRYNESLKSIFMDMTYLNNFLNESDYEKVTYELTFSNINNVNISNLLEKARNI